MNESKLRLGSRLKAWARGVLNDGDGAPVAVVKFRPPEMLPGVIPTKDKIAMDEGLADAYSYANQSFGCQESFPGYPVLVQLTQIAEYRMLSEKTAMAMTRKWIKLRSKGDEDKTEKLGVIEDEMSRLRVRELFAEAAKLDGFFGRAQLFIDLGEQTGDNLRQPLFKSGAVLKGKLRKFKVIEAMFTYPNDYGASNPMADDYYNPRTWFVMGQRVHRTRLLTFVGRPLPDLLKPAYNFGGMSMSQLARPYVENWIKTRNSVNKLLSNFSTSGIKTNLDSVLSGGDGEGLLERAQLYTDIRDNQGLMLLDNETEEFFQCNVPLSTVDKLQAQAQEHMSSVASMPLPVLTGITPAGLNASAEGDIEIFHDHVSDMQEVLFRDNLATVVELIQLSKFGEVDPDITFDFVPLKSQDEGDLAANRKSDAEAAEILINAGVIRPEEARAKLAADEHSGYNGLDVNDIPEPVADPMDDGEGEE